MRGYCCAILLFLAVPTWAQTTQPTDADIRRINRDLVARVASLQKEIDALKKQLTATEARLKEFAPEPELAEKIADAIKNETLCVGMTLADADKSMKRKGGIISESSGTQDYQWDFGGFSYFATVADGKLIDWRTGKITAAERVNTIKKK